MFGFEGAALSNYIYFTALGKTKFFLRLYEVKTFSSIAQSVEHSAVNRSVVGSSPTSGAIPVTMAVRIHLFPYRTQKLSSLAPEVVGF